MVSMTQYGVNGTTYVGLSDDDKPTTAENGAVYLEMNTGKIYMFDASEGGSGWLEWGASS